jgi:hypothetical protein
VANHSPRYGYWQDKPCPVADKSCPGKKKARESDLSRDRFLKFVSVPNYAWWRLISESSSHARPIA